MKPQSSAVTGQQAMSLKKILADARASDTYKQECAELEKAMSVYVVPNGMLLTGTCGACGGPILSPAIYFSDGTVNAPPSGQCGTCGRHAKPDIEPTFGPVKEMQ